MAGDLEHDIRKLIRLKSDVPPKKEPITFVEALAIAMKNMDCQKPVAASDSQAGKTVVGVFWGTQHASDNKPNPDQIAQVVFSDGSAIAFTGRIHTQNLSPNQPA